MPRRRSDALLHALSVIAPGQPLREGVDRILQSGMGALIVVGDGIETERQRAFLAHSGCDEGQGPLFGPAVQVTVLPRHGILA